MNVTVNQEEAAEFLRKHVGEDLRAIAEAKGVTVWTPYAAPGHIPHPSAKINKGWAGQTIERMLGLAQNSSQQPDFGSWELKVVPLARTVEGELRLKETMAITMIDTRDVLERPFLESHLYVKLRRLLIVARIWVDKNEAVSPLHAVGLFSLTDPALLEQVKQDYDEVRSRIAEQGLAGLSGKMGVLVQPRTKGPGHGSTTRAFYARKTLVGRILGIST